MAFAALFVYMQDLDKESDVVRIAATVDVLHDLLDLLATNLNQNRIFLPTLVTATKLFGKAEALHWTNSVLCSEEMVNT